jgi:hypothetical protein
MLLCGPIAPLRRDDVSDVRVVSRRAHALRTFPEAGFGRSSTMDA